MKDVKRLIIGFLIFCSILMILTLYSHLLPILSGRVQPVMSCAGIKTHPRCAKFCTHEAVATCESSVDANIRNTQNQLQHQLQQINRNYQNQILSD